GPGTKRESGPILLLKAVLPVSFGWGVWPDCHEPSWEPSVPKEIFSGAGLDIATRHLPELPPAGLISANDAIISSLRFCAFGPVPNGSKSPRSGAPPSSPRIGR